MSDDMREAAGRFMLSAGVVMGDKVDAGKVQDMLEQFGTAMRPKRRPGTDFGVEGIVAVRDKTPYVQLLWQGEVMVQLDMPQARQVAMDIVQMAARTEADAGLISFLTSMDFDERTLGQFITGLRDFRQKQDSRPTAEPRQ